MPRTYFGNAEFYNYVTSSNTHVLSRIAKTSGGPHALMSKIFVTSPPPPPPVIIPEIRLNIIDKTIIITGGCSGIGYAYAEALLTMGNRVVIISHRDPLGVAAEFAAKYPTFAANILGIYADVRIKTAAENTNPSIKSMEEAFQEASAFSPSGVVDIVIANAGINGTVRDTLDIINTNLIGVIHTIEPFMKQITNNFTQPADASKQYQIIVTGSIACVQPCDMNLSYGYDSSKAGVAHLVRGLRPIATRYNFRINAVCPAGMVRTRLTESYFSTPEKAAAVYAYQNSENRGGVMLPSQIVPGLLEVLTLPSYNGDLIMVNPNLGFPYRLEPRDEKGAFNEYGIYDERQSPSTKGFIDFTVSQLMSPL